jgi:hypothetical protein
MYLDPGLSSLFVQGLFALFATAIVTAGRYRAWLVSLWQRVADSARKIRRRPEF